jgi:hypothetical protein
LYDSPNIVKVPKSRKTRWVGHVAHIGTKRNVERILVGRLKGKRSLGKHRHRWKDNIKMDRRDTGWAGVDWIDLTGYGPVKGSCEQGNTPSGCIKCWEVLEYMSDWRLLKKDSAPGS